MISKREIDDVILKVEREAGALAAYDQRPITLPRHDLRVLLAAAKRAVMNEARSKDYCSSTHSTTGVSEL